MKFRNIFSATALAVVALAGFVSCDTDVEKETIQHQYKYDPQYLENLRAFKKSPHEVSYAYYASYTNTLNPTSWGERILGLPDKGGPGEGVSFDTAGRQGPSEEGGFQRAVCRQGG